MNEDETAQVVAVATTWVEDMLREELRRACARLLAEGMPESQIAQLLEAAAEMHAGQVAFVEREAATALGAPPAIH